jgi:hypothetical protein
VPALAIMWRRKQLHKRVRGRLKGHQAHAGGRVG